MAGSTHVADGKVVVLHYKLSLGDEPPVVDTRDDGEPMSYLHGAENIVPGLERQLAGRSVGETITATVSPEEGYGAHDPEAVQTLPRETFPDDLPLEVGVQLTAEDEDGNLTPLFVREVTAEHVVVDLNHPLAGQTLQYEVTIVEIREATDDELEHGHAHGPDDHHHDH